MKYLLTDFAKEAQSNVFVLNGDTKNEIRYSDGDDIENKIYNILTACEDRSTWSSELISKISDWPTEYHFSPVRHNLLRHINFLKSDQILELGCGCGAITRQLGESGAGVTSIEGTLNRAKCAAARCYDLSNVSIYCSNFQDLAFDRRYDYVTLIGVMEYAPLFFKGQDPFGECLSIVKSALKPGGKLIIAIENRMGLKYFNGLGEDHVNKPYFGIEDRYSSRTAKTLGRYELTDLLKKCGFNALNLQFPFPDYKLPEVVIDEGAFTEKSFNCSELIRSLTTRDYSKKWKPSFSEFLVWKTVTGNRLIADLSNSFLVLAATETTDLHNDLLAVKYTTNRKLEYNTRTEFKVHDGEVNVVKSRLANKIASSENLVQQLSADKYYEGESLSSLLKEKVLMNDYDGFVAYIKLWLSYLTNEGLEKPNSGDIYNVSLRPDFIDALPSNIIVRNGSLSLIDKEWVYHLPFNIKTLFIRYWLNETWSNDSPFNNFISTHISLTSSSRPEILMTFAKVFNMELDRSCLEENFEKFSEIGEIVYGTKTNRDKLFGKNPRQFRTKNIYKLKNKLKRIIRRLLK